MNIPVEQLESRRLLSVNLTEAEPNNSTAGANAIARVLDTHMIVSGRVNAAGRPRLVQDPTPGRATCSAPP